MSTKQADDALEQQFAVQAARFNALATDCRLSFLEIKLYRKYFIETHPKTPEKLKRLHQIIATLESHRANTIAVLKAIHEREQIVDAVFAQIDRINNAPNRNASILDFQSDGLHLIYLHQQVTLRVVEAVEAWRRPLTRPFSFVHQGENYFVKVLADCADISASSLGKILPVKLAQYPLCSDLPSLCLFVTANPVASSSSSAAHAGGKKGGGAGAAATAGHPQTRMTSEMSAKIHSAQAILLEELETQKRLLRELEGLSSAGYFLPVLNLHSIIPSSSTGIRMSNYEWEEQLREAISVAKLDLDAAESRVHHPAAATPSRGDRPHQQQQQQYQHHNSSGARNSEEDDGFASSSGSDVSKSSSPASTPRKDESPQQQQQQQSVAPSQKRVSIDENPRQQPAAAPSSGPAPPPRPVSAKKRAEIAAAEQQNQQQAKQQEEAAAKEYADEFEKDGDN